MERHLTLVPPLPDEPSKLDDTIAKAEALAAKLPPRQAANWRRIAAALDRLRSDAGRSATL